MATARKNSKKKSVPRLSITLQVSCRVSTPGGNSGSNHWHTGNWGYGGVGLSINVAQPVSEGDCYYVRRRVMTDIGVITRRQLVCE